MESIERILGSLQNCPNPADPVSEISSVPVPSIIKRC